MKQTQEEGKVVEDSALSGVEEDSASNGAAEDEQIITNAAGDEVFETLRMQLEEERSQMKEDLTINDCFNGTSCRRT